MRPTTADAARRRGAWLLAFLAAVVCCGYGTLTYARTRTDADLTYAHSRDAALDAARRHITTLNTVDGSDVAASLRRWRDAADGPLADELRRTGAKGGKTLAQEGTTTQATVTDAALTSLDDRAGTAKAIATVRVEVTPRTGDATTDRKRFEAALTRTGGAWRLSSLSAVAATES
ncbi:hypothetical protein [Streptomyces sp. SLBN-118]|uniref:hypothetical protein n=1 Tax=Streptomyces sp. SLBN-118 TaxID=2768454 RepID=UPI00114DDCB2|nr:hypothetical protein [Streptomyces sp. SLBN-118]